MSNILSVNNLSISFRTNNGTVKAVRDVSFDLEKGETLAIVGESGSGKSVTNRAIMGILAGNSIVESGEILYDGNDLLKITEKEFHKLRGDRIAMIFQDPLSSLNPIVRIGKQITEAMLLKNKTSRKASRKEFNTKLAALKKHITATIDPNDKESINKVAEYIKTFDTFNIVALKYEYEYNYAKLSAEELKSSIEDFLFRTEKQQKFNAPAQIRFMIKKFERVKDIFFTRGKEVELNEFKAALIKERAELRKVYSRIRAAKDFVQKKKVEVEVPESTLETLKNLSKFLTELDEREEPNFFCLGYYLMKNPKADVFALGNTVAEFNTYARKYLDDNFMLEFIKFEERGVEHSYKQSIEGKKKVLSEIDSAIEFFQNVNLNKKEATAERKRLVALVDASIDALAPMKDTNAYVFEPALKNALKKFFFYKKNNPKEEARFAKQTAKRNAIIAKGKSVDWKVVPKNVVPLERLCNNIKSVFVHIKEKYTEDVTNADNVSFKEMGIALIDDFKEKASRVVYRVTHSIARERAVKLMEEVGIPEPRIRYRQYPFEFSGGMRQRIVIAIALSANPEILICDEPTTALDVTIQSQILELINKLKVERNLSVIFITHDLGVVANMADRIAVMYAGKIVEQGTADDIFYNPKHPYTWALLSSMPDLDMDEKLDAIPGTPPNMIYPPVGDAFAARNKYAMKIDFERQPPMFEVSPTHYAATWLLHPDAPKVETPRIILDRIARMRAKLDKEQSSDTGAMNEAQTNEAINAQEHVPQPAVEVEESISADVVLGEELAKTTLAREEEVKIGGVMNSSGLNAEVKAEAAEVVMSNAKPAKQKSTTTKSAAKTAVKPASKPAAKSTGKTTTKSASSSAAKSTTKTTSKATAKTATKSTAKSTAKKPAATKKDGGEQ